ncbi:Aoah, partial [Columba livia]
TAERKLQMGIGCCQKKHLSLPSDKSQRLLAQRQSGAVILAGRRLCDNQKGANKNPLPGDNLSRKERLDLPPSLSVRMTCVSAELDHCPNTEGFLSARNDVLTTPLALHSPHALFRSDMWRPGERQNVDCILNSIKVCNTADRMRGSRQIFLNLFCILWLTLLLKAASSSPLPHGNDPPAPSLPSGLYKGHTCVDQDSIFNMKNAKYVGDFIEEIDFSMQVKCVVKCTPGPMFAKLWQILIHSFLKLLVQKNERLLDSKIVRRGPDLGCVLVVSVIEQLAQWHNSTVKAAMERLCNYIPEKLQGFCYVLAELYGPHIAELIDKEMNADVVCHSLKLCKQDPGQPLCHLYPPPKVGLSTAIRKAKRMMKTSKDLKSFMGFSSVCTFPLVANLCEKIKHVIRNKLPFEDFDGDKFSTFPTLRGYHWRGRDCDDKNATVYPGRRPDNWDVKSDSNCNGIWGVDPKDGIPYEEKFCEGADSQGVVLLGDSAGAHFHIPPEWMTVTQMSAKSFSNLPMAFTDEFDWPQFSEITGFLNSTIGGWTDSLYLRLRRRNRCNHRDLQNISQNGGSSGNLRYLIKSLARNQLLDNPAIVIYATIGNDVCNGNRDTLAHMTTPKEMLSNVVQALQYLDSHLPNGSHVILTGLSVHLTINRPLAPWLHPVPSSKEEHHHSGLHSQAMTCDILGQLNRDITYSQIYSFLDCLQVSPCSGWLTPNETLRNLTSERALQLSNVLKEIARSEKFANFDIFYMDFPLKQTAEEWQKMGGEPWQLIEPVDGFHPSQIAGALGTSITWQKALREWPQVLGKENPFNEQIEAIFKDQGGH